MSDRDRSAFEGVVAAIRERDPYPHRDELEALLHHRLERSRR